MIKRIYGWLPDIPDYRDKKYKRSFKFFLPQHVDLRNFCSPVEDQGSLGSCTAQAITGALELLDRKDDNLHTDLSRLFIYYNERLMRGTVLVDSGAYIRDGIKSLAKIGVCSEAKWPYVISRFILPPGPLAYAEAFQHRISEYQRLSGLDDTLNALSCGFPVVFGIAIYESFQTEFVSSGGIVPMPNENETLLGGHAVLAVGYDLPKKHLIMRNSWGDGWGDSGYFYLPFEYVKKLASDFWVIRK